MKDRPYYLSGIGLMFISTGTSMIGLQSHAAGVFQGLITAFGYWLATYRRKP